MSPRGIARKHPGLPYHRGTGGERRREIAGVCRWAYKVMARMICWFLVHAHSRLVAVLGSLIRKCRWRSEKTNCVSPCLSNVTVGA
jgi:hypothetical protein